MPRGLLLAWLVGETIVIYRTVRVYHRPPMPGEILGTSGLFVLLALLAEVQPGIASALGWGMNVAAFLALAPTIVSGPQQVTAAPATRPIPGTNQVPAGTTIA